MQVRSPLLLGIHKTFRLMSTSLTLLSLLLLSSSPTTLSQRTPSPSIHVAGFDPYSVVIIISILVLFGAVAFLSVYITCPRPLTNTSVHPEAPPSRQLERGLDPAILESFPTMKYSEVKEHRLGTGSLDCAVCLCEFEKEERLRLLPECNHAFHTECVDMWLHSHTTCPVCRCNLVSAVGPSWDHVVVAVAQQVEDVRRLHETGGREGVEMWGEEERERFTLRLPEEVREEVMRGKRLRRSATMKATTGGESLRMGRREREARSERWATMRRTWSLERTVEVVSDEEAPPANIFCMA